ncbi:MAG TPA: AAA family ATPase, partial [Candidatus Limnocylindria bacterium]|nr:AAA family ATPase [Candidatus Limnocylindria bacterium]
VSGLPDLPAGLVLQGEAGIGKSTLWQAACELAAAAGLTVLTCRPAGAEVRLSFSALTDLLEGVTDGGLAVLPAPQRRAVEVALLRSEAGEQRFDERAVFAGTLALLRNLASEGPLAIAVDDAQWLDGPSASALEYVARRVRTEPIAFVVAVRGSAAGVPLGLYRALGTDRLQRVAVGPMSLGALHRLLRAKAGASFSRPTLRRIHGVAGGNPFFALELARDESVRRSQLRGVPSALPDTLHELLGRRLAELPSATGKALFVAAAASQPTVDLLSAALGEDAGPLLEPAEREGVIRLDGGAIQFEHPLLAAAAYAANRGDRRSWHARLAELSTDLEERARHGALAVDGPDEGVASLLMAAGRHARSRGAPAAAAELFEAAIERTPRGAAVERGERTVEAARTLLLVGERARARTLLEAAIPALDAGGVRSDALLVLSTLVESDPGGSDRVLELINQALAEADADPRRQAAALLSREMWERHRERLEPALHFARQALALADGLGDNLLLARALTRTADLEVLLGMAPDPITHFARALEVGSRFHLDAREDAPRSMLAACLARAGRVDEARALLLEEGEQVTADGDESSLEIICLFLAEVEWLAGNWDEARARAEEGIEVAEASESRMMQGAITAVLSLVEAGRGQLLEAEARAREGLALSREVGDLSYEVYNRQVLGFVELSRGNPAAAHDHLAVYAVERGIEGTKRISFIGDAIEALIELGRLDEAAPLVDELERRGSLLHRPTLAAASLRCRALLESARGDASRADALLADALAIHADLGLRFEHARTLLILGEIRRRGKQKRAAREALESARDAFTALGAPLWAARAERELARIGGRAPAGELTPTERRVADLVAQGMSNKEVAAAMFVSVRAVEANLSRIYDKEGISSRTELVRRQLTPDAEQSRAD